VRAALRAEAPWQDRDVALLDFENGSASCTNGTPETRDAVVVMAPAGTYNGVVFTLGVPFSRNHEDLAKARELILEYHIESQDLDVINHLGKIKTRHLNILKKECRERMTQKK
jgi:hypothetical protein